MSPEAAADLARSGISPADAEAAGMFETANAEEWNPSLESAKAIVIPYYDLEGRPFTFTRDGGEWPFLRVRYLEKVARSNGFASKSKFQRYGQPAQSGCRAYFAHTSAFQWAEIAGDVEQYVIITEGEKKALAACLAGFPTIGLGGVYNFLRNGELLPELDAFKWEGRTVFICFDSDAKSNPDIQAAQARLAQTLELHRGANIHICDMPDGEGGVKVGIDDALVQHGPEAFKTVLQYASKVSAADREIMRMNEHLAWIENEGLAYALQDEIFLPKDQLKEGSVYSTWTVPVMSGKKNEIKHVGVAGLWLKSRHAQRYHSIDFNPERPRTYAEGKKTVLNRWTGYDVEPLKGDLTHWHALLGNLFSRAEPEIAEFAIKTIAYKFQNPGEKPPSYLLFVGDEGSGKSMFMKLLRRAMGKYGKDVKAKQVFDVFNGWLENCLLATMDEFQSLQNNEDAQNTIKTWATEKDTALNEKYRVQRQGKNFCYFILSANNRKTAASSLNDRRACVVATPSKRKDALTFWPPIHEWAESDAAPRQVLHYFLNYDLKGWKPPAFTPMSQLKHAATKDAMTAPQRIAEAMFEARPGLVPLWIMQTLDWCNKGDVSSDIGWANSAKEVRAAVMQMTVRPWYTSNELHKLLTAILHAMEGSKLKTDIGELSLQLQNEGIPLLRNRDTFKGFMYRGLYHHFLVVQDFDHWSEPITQNEFDRQMAQFPSVAQLVQSGKI